MEKIPENFKQILLEKYHNGETSKDNLYYAAHGEDKKITRKIVKEFLDNLTSYQLTKSFFKAKEAYKTSWALYPNEIAQTDIMYLTDTGKRKENYLLTWVDVYSRYAFVRLLKTRDSDEVIKAFKSIIEEIGKPPKNLRFDNEFNKKVFLDFFEKQNIRCWPAKPNDMIHNGIVERFHRTLRLRIRQYVNAQKSVNKNFNKSDYIPKIYDIVNNYNDTIHSTTKNTPTNIWFGLVKNEQKVVHNKGFIHYEIGSKVKVLEKRGVFDKSSAKNTWSTDTYIVVRKIGPNYVVRNIKNKEKEEGPYRGNELSPAV